MFRSLEMRQMAPCPVDAAGREFDVDWLQRCRDHDPAALRQFVAQYQRMVFAFLSRAMGAGPHVEDLAQEVFLRASRALPRFDIAGPAKLSTWLLTIASRVAADARKKRRLKIVAPEQGLRVAESTTPETEAQRREIGTALARAAAELSDEQREVFVLAEFHGLTMAEIGVVLGAQENTIKQRLFRARERLRELLADLREG
jgi:RNA polymerase sigma-70 factor, ECF subfamily